MAADILLITLSLIRPKFVKNDQNFQKFVQITNFCLILRKLSCFWLLEKLIIKKTLTCERFVIKV
ncbi:hypothetical protein GCM10007962_06180 [Yeosuana aromativorans]|uniref:Uncharacterized protein n=1 Tax=Yeosuana aromativorans TaxID=288019 RepID=A0A8J3BHI8_9FLAO|nr:hypothetical protein GCM10007962_06180 [Yeosuana aromativorans]